MAVEALHRVLEPRLAAFLGTDHAILFSASFDANSGLFEPSLRPEDAIVSDALNHALMIDAFARRGATAAPMRTWPSPICSSQPPAPGKFALPPTAFSRCTVHSHPLDETAALAERHDVVVIADECNLRAPLNPRSASFRGWARNRRSHRHARRFHRRTASVD